MEFKGAARRAVPGEIVAIAKDLGVSVPAFRAVITVEAAGSGFDKAGRPKALFERHHFFKHLKANPDQLEQAIAAGLAYRTWGEKPYPKGSDAVYSEIVRACEINENAALLSTSWGLGQVMGSNYKMVGCASVEDMVREAVESEAGQLRQMAGFIKSANLVKPMKDLNWAAFAKGYNGPGYAKNAYDTKLAQAHAKFMKEPNYETAPPPAPVCPAPADDDLRVDDGYRRD
jgi:hypothetical protein